MINGEEVYEPKGKRMRSDQIPLEFCKWLGLDPNKISALTIVMEVGQPVIVDVAYYLMDDVGDCAMLQERCILVPEDSAELVLSQLIANRRSVETDHGSGTPSSDLHEGSL